MRIILDTFEGNNYPVSFDKNAKGISIFQLPNKRTEESFEITLIVHIKDDSAGIIEYSISPSVIVEQNDAVINKTIDDLLNSENAINNLKNESILSITWFIDSFFIVLEGYQNSLNVK